MDINEQEKEFHEELPFREIHKHDMLKGVGLGVVLTCLLTGGILLYQNTTSKETAIRRMVDRHYLNEVDEKAVTEGAYAGMVEALEDPYSTYYTDVEYEETTEDNKGSYRGIGTVMQQNQESGVVTIVRCFDDTPASRAGIQQGDIIYKVNDETVAQEDIADVAKKIQESGEEGIRLTLIREGLDDYLQLELKSEQIETPVVSSSMLEDQIGYLAIYEFNEATLHQYQEAFEELNNQGMKRIIIDLRSNPGGLMSSVTKILDTILPEGIIVYTMDKYGKRQDYMGGGKTPLQIPMVVLTNGYTASASEIFAGAVRDYDLAKLVGTKTYGKGVVQQLFPMGDGSALKLTVANYYTPKGVNINGTGLEPDVKVELDTSSEGNQTAVDNQLQKAIETVKGMD